MQSDEEKIRQFVTIWTAASQSGDVETVLSLMTDDAVFLVPGTTVMRKADFAAAARAQSGPDAPHFEGTSEILELQVAGDWAYLWTRLTVVATAGSAPPVTRAGHTLSILSKHEGLWRLARDANLLAVAKP